jgi:hypothetical protein
MIAKLDYPAIDWLLDRFKEDSRPFFTGLSSIQRKELRKYLNYRKASHKDNWSFSPFTVATLNQIDRQAEQFYSRSLKYKQLSLNLEKH